MEWIRGGPLPGAAFQIDQAQFTLPPEVMNKSEVVASGLGMLMRKEGFKDIPPVVPRTPDGALIISRPADAFELLVQHLLGLEPLTRVPLHLFADKYIALKSELAFWQLPTEDVPFHDHIYFETAWTDEHCVFPLAPVDAEAFRREKTEEPATGRRAVLQSIAERPEELSEELLHAADKRRQGDEGSPPPPEKWAFFLFDASGGDAAAQGKPAAATPGRLVFAVGQTRFLCKIPFISTPCVHYGKLPDRSGTPFPPFLILPSSLECTLVWTAGCFVHIKVKENTAQVSAAAAARAAFSSSTTAKGPLYAEVNVIEQTPSWICFHPILDFVLSGVRGPVPNVQTFDMPNASAVRFYPWGAVVINGEVELQPRRKLDTSGAGRPLSAAGSASGPVGEGRRSTDDNMKRLMTYLPGQQPAPRTEGADAPQSPPRAVVVASILRSQQKTIKPVEKIFMVNMDHENEAALKMRHGVDYDVLDMRNQEGTDFDVVVSVRGCLARRQRADFLETKRNEIAAVVAVEGSGRLTAQAQALIRNGVPPGEMLHSLTLTGEYVVSDRQYYKFELGTKLFEFHRSLYMLRASQSAAACNVM